MNRLDVLADYNRLTTTSLRKEDLVVIADRSELASRISKPMQTELTLDQEKIRINNLALLHPKDANFQQPFFQEDPIRAVALKALSEGKVGEEKVLKSKEIAFLDAEKSPAKFLRNLKEYDLKNPRDRSKAFKMAVHNTIVNFSDVIRQYQIRDQDVLIELAATAAAKDGRSTSKYIRNYGIKDQEALIGIARIAAANKHIRANDITYKGISKYIQNYGIKDLTALSKIAEIDAIGNGRKVSKYIRNYGIQDQTALIRIAETAAAQGNENGVDYRGGLSEFLRNYGIKDRSALAKIAEIALVAGDRSLSKHIRDYGIQDQDVLIRMAETAAAQNGRKVSKYIRNYGIQDRAALIRIAETAAQGAGNNREHKGSISEFIRNYGIQDQKALIRIAKIAVDRNARDTSQFIHRYGIQDRAALIRIAEKSAVQNGRKTSYYIGNYGIQDQSALARIARLAAFQDGLSVSQFIRRYGIKDPAARIKIAKIAANQSGRSTYYIGNYGITDQSALIEIAEIAAAQDGWSVSEFIPRYGIKDPAALIKIAKIAAVQNGVQTLIYIGNYKISDREVLLSISRIAAKRRPSEVIGMRSSVFPRHPDYPEWHRLALFCLLQELLSEGITKRFVSRRIFVENCGDLLQNDKLKKGIGFKEVFSRCILVYMKSYFEKALFPEREKIVKEISDYRGRVVAVDLLVDFCDASLIPDFMTNYFELSRTKREITVHKILPSILPAKWLTLSKDPLEPEQQLFADFFAARKREFRNVNSPLMSMYLSAARALEESDLSFERKFKLLAQVCACKQETLKGLGFITTLCCRKETKKLDRNFSDQAVEELSDVFKQALLSDLFLDLSSVENVADKYQNSFGRTRIPMALETYRSKLAVGCEESVRATLERFVISVLEGTLAQERYRTDNNPHLKRIQENNAEPFQRWQETSEPTPLVPASQEEEVIDYDAFFQLKLNDRHWHNGTVDLLPGLTAFLERKPFETPDVVTDCCVRLCEESTLSEEDRRTILQTILQEMQRRNLASLEFCNDVRGLLSSCRTSGRRSQETVGRSTDWQDLFLAGSEVSGSCQRVDGDPLLNRCLLTYCLDGKNSVMVVKDVFSGKISARALLRLLWDSQNDKPVLFLDRLYPATCGKEKRKALLEEAKKEANRLGLDLTTKDFPADIDYPGKVVSLGSSCPYEYADGGDGVSRGGVFSISYPKKVGLS